MASFKPGDSGRHHPLPSCFPPGWHHLLPSPLAPFTTNPYVCKDLPDHLMSRIDIAAYPLLSMRAQPPISRGIRRFLQIDAPIKRETRMLDCDSAEHGALMPRFVCHDASPGTLWSNMLQTPYGVLYSFHPLPDRTVNSGSPSNASPEKGTSEIPNAPVSDGNPIAEERFRETI